MREASALGAWRPKWLVPGLNRPLTRGEDALLEAWSQGSDLYLLANGETLKPLEVEAQLIENVLFGLAEAEDGSPFKISHRGAKLPPGTHVKGALNLTALEFNLPIEFDACRFDGSIIFNSARIGPLALKGAAFPSLWADTARIAGDLDLQTCEAKSIDLRGARIDGGLDLSGAQIGTERDSETVTASERCLNCETTDIGGTVFLRSITQKALFLAFGEVCFVGAKIGGQLICSGGKFTNPNGKCLSCSGVRVGESVYLRTNDDLPFLASGEVNFVGAALGSQLVCNGGTFKNPNGKCLHCEGADIRDTVLLRNGFSSEGEVSFLAAKIGRSFDLSGEVALNCGNGTRSLTLQEATISSTLWLASIEISRGVISLLGARADTLIDDTSAWRLRNRLGLWEARKGVTLLLDGFTYGRFADANIGTGIFKSWLKMQPKPHLKANFRPQPWVQCARVLEEMGHSRDALLLGEAREWMRLGHWPRTFAEVLLLIPRFFIGAFTGFGYAYVRMASIATFTILFGALVFKSAYNEGVLIHTTGEMQPMATASHPPDVRQDISAGQTRATVYPAFNSWMYSLDTFLPAVSLRQKEYWVPGDNQPAGDKSEPWLHALGRLAGSLFKAHSFADAAANLSASNIPFPKLTTSARLVWLWTWFEIIMGWVISTGFVARFTGLLDRKN